MLLDLVDPGEQGVEVVGDGEVAAVAGPDAPGREPRPAVGDGVG